MTACGLHCMSFRRYDDGSWGIFRGMAWPYNEATDVHRCIYIAVHAYEYEWFYYFMCECWIECRLYWAFAVGMTKVLLNLEQLYWWYVRGVMQRCMQMMHSCHSAVKIICHHSHVALCFDGMCTFYATERRCVEQLSFNFQLTIWNAVATWDNMNTNYSHSYSYLFIGHTKYRYKFSLISVVPSTAGSFSWKITKINKNILILNYYFDVGNRFLCTRL